MPDGGGGRRVDVQAGERGGHRDLERDQGERPLEVVQGVRLGQGEPAGAGAAQRGEVPADAQPRPEVPGQRAHIGTAGHGHLDVEVEHAVRPAQVQQVEAAHGGRAGRQLRGLPRPDGGVGTPPVDLDRAHRRGHLQQVAGQGGDPGPHGLLSHRRRVGGREHLALGVVGHRRGTQPDRGRVLLVVGHQVGQQPGGLFDPEHQHPGGHRVERARMTHLPRAGQPAHPGHHVVRRPPGRLVDDDQPGRRTAHASSASSSSSTGSTR